MNYDDIKIGKKYVVYKEWRDIKDEEYAKYVEVTQRELDDWIEIKWLHSHEKDHLPPACFEREANLPKDKGYLLVLAI